MIKAKLLTQEASRLERLLRSFGQNNAMTAARVRGAMQIPSHQGGGRRQEPLLASMVWMPTDHDDCRATCHQSTPANMIAEQVVCPGLAPQTNEPDQQHPPEHTCHHAWRDSHRDAYVAIVPFWRIDIHRLRPKPASSGRRT